MGLMQTIGPAFENLLPGPYLFDWLVALMGGVLLRVFVWQKSKKAKKFRRDMEYGSARWGTAKDIKSFIDPKPQNNVILTGTEFLTINTRPKNPANAWNLNACVIGSSGSGKTRFWLTPIYCRPIPAQEDYTDSETGLLHCGKCHTPIQCRVTLFDKEKLMPCTCRCRQEQIAAEEQARKEQQRLDRIRRLKANGLQDKALIAYIFDKADNDNPAMKYAHRYVKHWAEVKAEGQGLLFWGGVGTGKAFAAACIANALTEQGVPVLMTNFSKILNSLSGMFSKDRNKYLASFGEFELLIIDDLGIERNSEYAQEQVYNVVDSRYLSRLPFIITTNLTLAELKDPKDIAHARIYDRILERCAPVRFSGRNYRTENAENTKKAIREIFAQEDSL